MTAREMILQLEYLCRIDPTRLDCHVHILDVREGLISEDFTVNWYSSPHTGPVIGLTPQDPWADEIALTCDLVMP